MSSAPSSVFDAAAIAGLLSEIRRGTGLDAGEYLDIDLGCVSGSDAEGHWDARGELSGMPDGETGAIASFGVSTYALDTLRSATVPFPLGGHEHYVWIAAGAHGNVDAILAGVTLDMSA